MSAKIVISGASGYIGKATIQHLTKLVAPSSVFVATRNPDSAASEEFKKLVRESRGRVPLLGLRHAHATPQPTTPCMESACFVRARAGCVQDRGPAIVATPFVVPKHDLPDRQSSLQSSLRPLLFQNTICLMTRCSKTRSA